MRIVLVEERTPELVRELVSVWRASVEATHDFLGPDDIDRIVGYVPEALAEVGQLAVAVDETTGASLGFAGVDGDKLEMLFIDPSLRGRGIGRVLLTFATTELGAWQLDVNEQNPQARGFYEHCGWRIVGRSETDSQGDPYPLLHMEHRS